MTEFKPKILGDKILKDYRIKTLIGSEEIYLYKDGVYRKEGKSFIKEEATKRLGYETRANKVNETIAYIQASTYTKSEDTNSKTLLNLQNGLFDITTCTLQPHSPERFITSQLPIKYNPSAVCPKFRVFVSQVVDAHDVPLIQEMIGFCLLRDYFLKKAFMLYGEKNSGKSTLLDTVIALLGKENVSAVSLQDLSSDKFAASDLYGKLANIFADLPKDPVFKPTTFKMLTGKDLMRAQKKFRDAFTFFNHAKLLFSTNEIPKIAEDDDAYFDRWVLIPFPNTFEGESRNPHLLDELTSPEELSGIFNWAIEGLKRLLENGWFTYPKEFSEVKAEYLGKTSSVFQFRRDCLKESPSSYELKSDIYAAYCKYCQERKLKAEAENKFGGKLPEFIEAKSAQKQIGESRPYVWFDIKLLG